MSDSTPQQAGDPVLPRLYQELRELAHAQLRHERGNNRLCTTELVHEAYIRLAAQRVELGGREHALALAARMMRRVLVDDARARRADKRGGGWMRIELSEDVVVGSTDPFEMLALDAALNELESLDPQAAQVVEMRFFAGMKEQEIAGQLGCSDRWIRKQWAFAKAWLQRTLAEPGS